MINIFAMKTLRSLNLRVRLLTCRILSLIMAVTTAAGAYHAVAETNSSVTTTSAVPTEKATYDPNVGPQVPPGYMGIGPVVSGSVDYSKVPEKARKFLSKHCDGHAVVLCEKSFLKNTYDVGLADGIVMRFNAKGDLIHIKAPANYTLSPALLKAVVPGKLYHLLNHNGFDSAIESVDRLKGGYSLEVADPVFEKVLYGNSGVLTLVVEK